MNGYDGPTISDARRTLLRALEQIDDAETVGTIHALHVTYTVTDEDGQTYEQHIA